LKSFFEFYLQYNDFIIFLSSLLSLALTTWKETGPYVAINFTTYETLKEWAITRDATTTTTTTNGSTSSNPQHPKTLATPWSLAIGATAGATASTIMYPLDVVRKRLIVQGMDVAASSSTTATTGGSGGSSNNKHYRGVVDAIVRIGKEEGVRGYYKGLWACYLKVIPTTALMWWVMEMCETIFHK
jgi:solute carrier family 25 phosphate transporter 23/24/25/41